MPLRRTHKKSAGPASSRFPAEAAEVFARCRAPLRRWFAAHGRALPWRVPFARGEGEGGLEVGDVVPLRPPYAAWIAEIMLQQTQVATVAPRFREWMRRFPDVAALAAAPEEDVLRAWAGLGYYARARNLRRGAQALVARGAWPVSAAGWRGIPGVGDYTAGAIASIAFGRPEPILDGNVIRVFSRLLCLGFLPGDGAQSRRAYWDLARLWADADRPGELNEALMELGAIVCTPASPRCGDCPLKAHCTARASGRQGEFPPARKRARVEAVPAVALVVRSGGRVLLETRGSGGFLAGHAMFPLFLGAEAEDWRRAARERFPGIALSAGEAAGRFRHAIMSRRYEVEVRALEARGESEGLWLPVRGLAEKLTNSLAKKIWEAAKPEA